MGNHEHHGHAHGTENISTAFWLNLFFTLIELAGGFFTNSVAIMTDALHDFCDSLSLGFAWYFQKKSAKGRDRIFTYGYGRFSLIGALVNSIVLVAGAVLVLSEAIPRLMNPEESNAKGMLLLAVLGILVNGAAVFKLKRGHSLNERAVMLHLFEDVLGWLAVLVGSIFIYLFDWYFIDPLLSVGITIFILFNVYRNLKGVFRVILQGVPEGCNEEEIKAQLLNIEGIKGLHDLHIWTIDGSHNILTIHAVMEEGRDARALKKAIRHKLNHLKIEHATIEIDEVNDDCALASC